MFIGSCELLFFFLIFSFYIFGSLQRGVIRTRVLEKGVRKRHDRGRKCCGGGLKHEG